MPSTPYAGRTRFGLLPEPESNPASFVTSCVINGTVLVLLLIFGTVAHHEIQMRRMESTEIVFPTTPPPPIVKVKIKVPPPPKVEPKPQIAKLEPPKIKAPRIEPRPEPKPLPVIKEALTLPKIAAAKPAVVLAPQPKAALTAAAPALTPQAHPSVEPVHFGDMNGVRPNPNANRPATVAALGNPYGGSEGKAEAPRGVVGSTGIGNGTKSGSNAGSIGKVASAGIPGGTGTATTGGTQGHVASAGIPAMTTTSNTPSTAVPHEVKLTPPVLLSHAQPEYTSEAKQLKIQGDVVLRVTITTSGEMVVHNVIHGLGHGLDESAMRSAPTYRFRPATQNGQPVEYTTNIIIKFQTA